MNKNFNIITLCGSTKFKELFIAENKRLTLEGNIVLSVALFGHSGDDIVWTDNIKERLDSIHKGKINISDEIYVINPNGYIGESTRNEIKYALLNNKKIKYLEKPEKEIIIDELPDKFIVTNEFDYAAELLKHFYPGLCFVPYIGTERFLVDKSLNDKYDFTKDTEDLRSLFYGHILSPPYNTEIMRIDSVFLIEWIRLKQKEDK